MCECSQTMIGQADQRFEMYINFSWIELTKQNKCWMVFMHWHMQWQKIKLYNTVFWLFEMIMLNTKYNLVWVDQNMLFRILKPKDSMLAQPFVDYILIQP